MRTVAMVLERAGARESSKKPVDELLALRRDAYLLAVRVLGSPQGAEDAVQQAYLDAWRHVRASSPPQDVRTWFLRVVANAAKMHRRAEGRRQRREAAVMLVSRAEAPPDPELVLELRRALESLDERHRVPLSLCYEQGLSQEDAAAVMEIPRQTLAHHVGEGLELLRKALARSGHAAAPALVIGGLAHTAPPVPAGLAAAIENILAGKAVGTGAAAAPTAAKGGLTVKLLAGVVVAGALAGGIAVMHGVGAGLRPAPTALSSPPAQKGLSYEHYAFTSWLADSMDGPRREALGRGPGPLDEDFNCWLGGRVIRTEDGMVISVAGGLPEFGQDEGPAAFLPRLSPIRGTGYGQSIGGSFVVGLPLKGGDKGCLYFFSDTHIMKVWKNADKGGRWWAKILAGPGKVEIPGGKVYQGQAWRKPGEKADKAVFFTPSGFYALEEGSGGVKFNCLLNLDSIKGQLPVDKGKTGRPSQGVIDSGGYFYLGYYFSDGYNWTTLPKIQRVSPDGTKVEALATSCAAKGVDGPGMKTGWHCGPHMSMPRAVCQWYPAGVLIPSAHDEHTLRRTTLDGRLSTLYEDGEWREGTSYDLKKQVDGVSGFVYGANGWALGCAGGEGMSGKRGEGVYLIKGIDFTKPTAGK